jgi:hypothetical protein
MRERISEWEGGNGRRGGSVGVSPGEIRGEKKEKGKREVTGGEREGERGKKRKKGKREREKKTLTLESVRVFLCSNSYGHSRNHSILGLIS